MPDGGKFYLHGIRELRRDLNALEGATSREVTTALRAAAEPVRAQAAAYAPRRTGRLADSLRTYARGGRVGIRSRLPYANVQHWGGTISPRGTPIQIRRTEFISRAAEQQADRIGESVMDELDDLLRRHGFK